MEKRKLSSSSGKSPNVDRLSSLPDSILCHILSFLPTKLSAATSILARRWRFLCVDVPNIQLDFPSYPESERKKERPRTSDIINRILFRHNLKALNTFRLKYTNWYEWDRLTRHQLETWIAAVIAHGKVQNIELEFTDTIKMPECLFAYKSLVDLRLYNCEIRISLPASICLPSIEKLHLRHVQYNSDETFQHLISGCSLIEELEIEDIAADDLVCCRIFSPTLKRLTISFGDYIEDAWIHDFRLEISTPALRHLQVKDYLPVYISAQALTSLIEADVNLLLDKSGQLIEDDVVYSGSLLEFLDRMYNVEVLKLQTDYEKFPPSAFSISSSTPRFHNLTKLELAAGWRLISKFLELADNLQVLIINGVAEDLGCWVEPQQVFTCLKSHLRSIIFNYFGYDEYEYTTIRYLLKNAKVLTSMKIRCLIPVYNEKFAALQRISLFERGSEACKLDFC